MRPSRAKFAIPAGSIPAKGYKSFDDIQEFGLGWDGDEIVLSYLPGTADDRIVDAVSFKAQEPGVTLGRYPDGGPYWLRMTPSQDAANGNPIAGLMISEIMYHPIDPNEEYVELYNPTAQAIALVGRRHVASGRRGGLQPSRGGLDSRRRAAGDRRF